MYPTAVFRILTKGRRLLAPWLLVCLCAATASAAPRSHRHPVRRHPTVRALTPAPSCGTSLTLRALQHQSRAVAGPVAHTSISLHAELPHPTQVVQRGTPGRSGETEAAIVNDAPVAHIDVDRRVRPAFRALGVLACSSDRLPLSDAYSPLSSRGPPPHL